MTGRDTIAAIATAHGHAGIGVIRLSGAQAHAIAGALTGVVLRPRRARYCAFLDADGAPLDRGLALWFPAPRSYTGEDVVELQGHGNPVLLDAVLARLYQLGARPARPGEFTERAYLEGRIDLAQAEAVADLIAAGSQAAVRAAQRSLDGEFSERVARLQQALTEARIHVEAAIDFPDEDIEVLADDAIATRLAVIAAHHADLLAAAARGQRLRDGRVLAIVGRPNAGKSSLLNALAGSDRAIVTDVAGTTRDILREQVRLGPVELTLIDTAGLRDSGDAIEAEGVRRARAELARADHVLLVIDSAEPGDLAALRAECPPGTSRTEVFNKTDLLPAGARAFDAGTGAAAATPEDDVDVDVIRLALSLRTGAGLDALTAHLATLAGAGAGLDGSFSARARHVEALRQAGEHIGLAIERHRVDRAGELVAAELHQAQQALSQITGEHRPDDLLGEIFAGFCIGK
jgi:tRNA modification GTPase